MTWILLLLLVGPEGHGIAIESVPGFASHEACNDAGIAARGLPVLTPPKGTALVPGGRVDWSCVPTDARVSTDEARRLGMEKLRDELREVMRRNRETAAGGAP